MFRVGPTEGDIASKIKVNRFRIISSNRLCIWFYQAFPFVFEWAWRNVWRVRICVRLFVCVWSVRPRTTVPLRFCHSLSPLRLLFVLLILFTVIWVSAGYSADLLFILLLFLITVSFSFFINRLGSTDVLQYKHTLNHSCGLKVK